MMPSILLAMLFISAHHHPAEDTVPVDPADFGALYQPAYTVDEKPRLPAEVYVPQPGDVLFFDDHRKGWQFCFNFCGASRPMHSGIVVRQCDGSLASLEAGYNDTIWVEVVPLAERLHHFEGAVWVRRHCEPLTPEQTAGLAEFAELVNKRHFAVARLVGQMTPFRCRGPLRTYYLAKPHGLRRGYFCSECVTEALVWAGLLDAETTRPAATYPRDLFFDASNNLYLNRHFKLSPDWLPPQLWTPHVEE